MYQIDTLKALGGVDFTKYVLLSIIQYVHWSKIGEVQNAVNLSKIFLEIVHVLLRVHLQHVCNVPAKYKIDTLKALGGVDFIKYAIILSFNM